MSSLDSAGTFIFFFIFVWGRKKNKNEERYRHFSFIALLFFFRLRETYFLLLVVSFVFCVIRYRIIREI